MENNRLAFIASKVMTEEGALRAINTWKLKGDKIVFTNGCFDILHVGHTTYLANAATVGNRLIVGINTDDSVKSQNKGDNRPVNNEEARAMVLASLGFVDAVVFFNSDTPIELIKLLNPDVLVKGADYDENERNTNSKKYIVGSDYILGQGGSVKTISFVEGYSTTSLISKITAAE